ncbi:MAG: hypothetical protein M0R06_20730 [Sphaerochaeta sp.]|jgi:hypothetical protein|nr:hypothetical protein [Sphaerochaeta sp.]
MLNQLLAKPKSRLLLSKLEKRDNTLLQSVKESGDFAFADPTNQRYPLDTVAHVQAAIELIQSPTNASACSSSELKAMKARIKMAMTKHGMKVPDEMQGWEYDPLLPLTQDHYTVDGSAEELLSRVRHAFREWRGNQQDYEIRWSNILGTFGNAILIYTDSWDSDTDYYLVGYSVDEAGCVTITGELTRVDVKMVITALGVECASSGEEQSAMKKPDEKPQTQDAVPDESVIADAAATATPAQKSDDNVVPEKKKTDAETPGASTAEPADEAASGSGVEHSDDIPATKAAGDGSTTDAVKTALGKTAPGTKQDAPQKFDESKLLQGDSYDYGKLPLSFIQSHKTEEAEGKKLMKIQGIVTRGDIVNSKGEVYPTSVWESNLDQMNQSAEAGKFLGKLEHPNQEQGLVDAAIKFDKFWLQGDDLWADATIIPTEPYGKNLQALIEAGVQVDFSSRGYGSKQVQDWRGVQRPVIQDDFVCTAFDAVWHGASTGSGVKSVEYQSDPNPTNSNETQGDATTVEKTETQTQSAVEVKAAEIRAKAELKQTRAALVSEANLNEVGMQVYQTALDKCDSLENLIQTSETLLPHLQAQFVKNDTEAGEQTQSETYMPHFYVKQSKEELAPKNVGELFQRMVQDLPDGPARPGVPNHFTSPRKACYQMLCNVARETQGAFSGRNAALGLLALEQGKIDRAKDILEQSLPTGATIANGNVDGDGAPLSNYLIFPLIRRVYPMYIMNEIASIQPMDRPEGKIFYLDHYRVDAEAAEKRIDLNTSANPFHTSFADNATEGSSALQIRLRLASQLVQAHTKKLGAAWSIEEMQDLRAYHGLDAAQELLGGISREMALEWNAEVLNDMLAQATAAALDFGTGMPATGFTQQKDWDEYLWVYINKLDSAIFSKRNGPMTHIVCGVDAALALSKSMRGVFTFNDDNGVDGEIYPGTTFYGTVNIPGAGKYRVLRTNFWASGTANASKILGLRKGTEWSDTPYIWAPYTDYVTPLLTDPADFSQKQGVVSRAAKKVVVSDAMGYITVGNGTGEIL